MEVTYTFRHSEPSPVLRRRISDKLEKLSKYFLKATKAHVILNVEGSRHIAEITLSERHQVLFAEDRSHDMYQSVTGAVTKLERQLKKIKEKTKAHHHKGDVS
ncbi:MAG: ribosome-associated translation inhibitor RaiA [Deltaproteobacteria bacterium]|nr:ribosome-associated translation inhibitor RaiA [Deltaproteobacteria bacterium]